MAGEIAALSDLAHAFGGDLAIGPNGDLALADGPALTQQRVLRRLLTNTGDDIWHVGYGAGLAQFVGQPAAALRIAAVVRSQIFAEAAVAPTPEPLVDVGADAAGAVTVQVRYADAAGGQTRSLTFSLDA